MGVEYKPRNYNSLSPYLIVDEAEKLVKLLEVIFEAKILRGFNHPDGCISHTELLIDDSVLMISSSTELYPAHATMLHLYVPDVHQTFRKAIENGCKLIDEPETKQDDPDTRGSFYDFAGNYWSISSQN